MSAVTSPARIRVQRTAIAAVERARLTLVPVRRARAPRAPFAVLVLAVLGAGVVGLLMFNTHMQQGSFYTTKLQHQADSLTAQRQKLEMALESKRDPQNLAAAGRKLGLVVPTVPAFIDLGTGKVLGIPTVATAQDGMTIAPRPAKLPAPLNPKPIIVKKVLAPTTGTAVAAGNSQTPTGPASGVGTVTPGSNGGVTAKQGAHR